MKHDKPKIIIKKVKKGGHGAHHGGSWKIAYADFMTAMMALFLVLWLIGKSTPESLEQLAEYFRMPLKVALMGGNKSSTSENVIPGGGNDVSQNDGEVQKSDRAKIKSKESQRLRQEKQKMQKLKDRLEQLIKLDPRLQALRPHLLIDLIDQGLRIQIVDRENRPMFRVGSAEIESHMRTILHAIAPILNDIPNKLSLSGHTDDLVYAGGERGYSNWELSADRANASRRELISGGLKDGRILRVIGLASTVHLNDPHYEDASNRRISIVVLNQDAQEYLEKTNSVQGEHIFADDVLSQPEEAIVEGIENSVNASKPKGQNGTGQQADAPKTETPKAEALKTEKDQTATDSLKTEGPKANGQKAKSDVAKPDPTSGASEE